VAGVYWEHLSSSRASSRVIVRSQTFAILSLSLPTLSSHSYLNLTLKMSSESTSKRPRTTPSSSIPPARSDSGVSVLPVSRVNRIIKADQDVNLCSKEAIFLIAKATVRSFALYFSLSIRMRGSNCLLSSLPPSPLLRSNRNVWLLR